MAEENQQQVQQEPQQVHQVQRVTTKNPKKVEVGKRLAVHNRRKREEQVQAQKGKASGASGVSQYYGIGAVIAVGVIGGGLGYHIYRTKRPSHTQPNNPPQQPSPQTNKFQMY